MKVFNIVDDGDGDGAWEPGGMVICRLLFYILLSLSNDVIPRPFFLCLFLYSPAIYRGSRHGNGSGNIIFCRYY